METRGKKRAGRSKTQDSYTWFSDAFQLALFLKRACLELYDGSKGVFPETSVFAPYQECLSFSIGTGERWYLHPPANCRGHRQQVRILTGKGKDEEVLAVTACFSVCVPTS